MNNDNNKEDLKNSTLNSLKNSTLSAEEKATMAKEVFRAIDSEKNNTGIDKLHLFYDYLKSFFLPIYGFVIGFNKIFNEEDYVNGTICIILNIIEIILIITSLSGLFSSGKNTSSPISSAIGTYTNTYKAVSKPVGN
jgi:hypothetical protein